ncbi:MAG TPA: PAS domain S-box protein, partial [Candidatus Krumholzibacteria bacterium]|nr:PAS domain S-box protein [Candidatus Krumholzibacteria bacterium]
MRHTIPSFDELLAIYESILDGICVIDANAAILNANPAFTELSGYSREDLVGKPVSEVLDLDPIEDLPRFLSQARGSRGESLERKAYRRNGTSYLAEIHGVYSSYDSQPVLIAIVRDITERKERAKQYEEYRESLALIVQQSPMAIITWDTEFRVTQWNLAAERIFGHAREEAIGCHAEFIVPEAEREHVSKIWQNLMEMTGGKRSTNENVTKHGDTILCEWYNAPLIGANGEVLGVLSLVEDVTKLHSVEEQLRQSQKMEAIGRLAGGVAHDFNNMLNVILGYTELIQSRKGLDVALAEEIQEIDKAARRSADLTRQLLAFSRKQIISPRCIELNPAVESMQTTLSRLIGEDVDLVFKPGPDLWRIKIDPSQLDHILANLAANARDAMPQGGRLEIETKNVLISREDAAGVPHVAAGEFVQIAVRDTGGGIAPSVREHIFEPFFTTKDEATSTGLGLATVKSVVTQYGGFVRVFSEPGKGSSFELHFPRSDEGITPKSATRHLKKEEVTEKVLLVEDDPMVRDLVATVLKEI